MCAEYADFIFLSASIRARPRPKLNSGVITFSFKHEFPHLDSAKFRG